MAGASASCTNNGGSRQAAFPLALTFDGQQPFNVHGVPIADKLVRVPMPSNSSLIAQFRRAKTMTAYTQGQLFQFNLDQTGQLLPVLANCVAKIRQSGVASAGDFSVPPAAKPVAAAARRIRRRPSPTDCSTRRAPASW